MCKYACNYKIYFDLIGTWIVFVHNFPFHLRSAFFRSLRTNNDVVGWHGRINRRAGEAELPIDLMLELLTEEARTVDVNVRLVAENMAIRCQRALYQLVYIKLYSSFSNHFTFVVSISSFCQIQNKRRCKILLRHTNNLLMD